MTITTELFLNAKKSTFALAIVSLLCMLPGCSNTQSSLSYYLLHSAVPSEQTKGFSRSSTQLPSQALPQAISINLTNVTLPDYLKHRGLVYQVSDTNLHISTTHLWAEPFEEGLRKTLRDQLAYDYNILLQTKTYHVENGIELSLHISDFVSTFNGNVVLKGNFVVSSQRPERSRYPFFIETKLEKDGFSASIIAMRRALAVLVSEIASSTRVQ